MKYLLCVLISIGSIYHSLSGQTFINGDFEINTSDSCRLNLPDSVFNSYFTGVVAFGKGCIFGWSNCPGEIDILKDFCELVSPQSGEYCIGLQPDSASTDAVALELDSALKIGEKYNLIFYTFANMQSGIVPVIIGESLTDTAFGIEIMTDTPVTNTWKKVEIIFTATQASKYITVKNYFDPMGDPYHQGWNQIDNFTIEKITPSSLSEQVNRVGIRIYPNPANDFVFLNLNRHYNNIVLSSYDMAGNLIEKLAVQNSDYIRLSLSDYPKGNIVLKLILNNEPFILTFIHN